MLHRQELPETAEAARKRRWLSVALQFVLWTAIALISASQIYAYYRFTNRSYLALEVLCDISVWYLWGLLTPMIRLLARRFPIRRNRWIGPALLLLVTGIVTALGCITFIAAVLLLPRTLPYPFAEAWMRLFSSWFQHELVIFFAIVGVEYLLNYYRRFRERELAASQLEKQLAQAQLQALKMQLNPHFLFNTLHSIAILVRKQDNQTAVRMISGLGDLLRYVLQQGDEQEVLLKQELEFIEQYLDLEKLRFQDRMSVQLNIAPDTLIARIPNLILQPLVENAVRHSIAARADSGLIEIISWRDNGRLWLEVRDDGQGLSRDWRQKMKEGIGLSNTLERLKKLYGEDYQFDIQDAETHGAVARIGIPFRQ